ncbi:MAG: hypothetical protein ACJ77K_10150 [Bacteroidia bacterium]
MKKSLLFSFTIFLSFFFGKESKAQCMANFHFTSPMALNSPSSINGGGCGFEFFTPPINIVKPGRYHNHGKKLPAPLALRFGSNMSLNGTGGKNFNHIPLLSPGTGDASVGFQNMLYGINFSARFTSCIARGSVIPYVEGNIGYRYFASDMNVTPNDKNQKPSYVHLGSVGGLNTGLSGGLMFKFADGGLIDIGVMWSHSATTGEYVDIHSLKQIGPNIGYHAALLPNDFLVFKLGITGLIENQDWKDDGSGSGRSHGSHFHSCGGGHGGGHATIGLIKF